MKKIYSLIMVTIFLFAGAISADAWQMDVTNVQGDLTAGEYYTQNIYFHSDTGTDDLNMYFLTLDYDETRVELTGIVFQDYDDGDPLFPETIWDGGALPYLDEGDMVSSVMGTEPLGMAGSFIPAAGDTLMATVYWTALATETDVTVATWGDADASDFITVDGVEYWMPEDPVNPGGNPLLSATYDAGSNVQSLTASPVPIPGALVLMVSGLLGLTGLRRRTKNS